MLINNNDEKSFTQVNPIHKGDALNFGQMQCGNALVKILDINSITYDW